MVKTEGRQVTGIEKTRAAIQTSVEALRAAALAALEGHHKPTPKAKPRKQTAQESAALEVLSHSTLFTIEAIGTNLERVGLDFLDTADAVEALSEKAGRMLEEASARIPNGHAARKPLNAAKGALVSLEDSLSSFKETGDASLKIPPKRFLRAVGSVVVHFATIAGQHTERAQRELGEVGPLAGWLVAVGQDIEPRQ